MKFLIFSLGALLVPCFALAEELPDATQVAGQIGSYIRFEDTIKAVSKSRTHDGYYLSFGAPYPKQVLSVWVPSATRKHLPAGLLGRKVRISGMLQKSDTGPMLGLLKRDQFELLPIDESILSKLRIEGRNERREFNAAIRQHLEREDFDTIETLGRELHASKERTTDGTWLLEIFFGTFQLSPEGSNKGYVKRAQILADWRERYPNSNIPILIDANFHINIAWKWLESGEAHKISKETWENFQRELAEARHILEANPQAKTSPFYFIAMLRIARGQKWPQNDYFALFSEAVNREPDYFPFYFEAAKYLLPSWYGKEGDWEKFAQEERAKRSPEGDILYTRIAWAIERDYHNHLFDRGGASWEIMAAGFAALMQQYPSSRYLKNVYAHFAWEARDRARLAVALEAIKRDPDMEVWVNLENVQLAEKFANNEQRPTIR